MTNLWSMSRPVRMVWSTSMQNPLLLPLLSMYSYGGKSQSQTMVTGSRGAAWEGAPVKASRRQAARVSAAAFVRCRKIIAIPRMIAPNLSMLTIHY